MSAPNPYTFNIDGSKNSGRDEGSVVHQTSPAWVLTFTRFYVQDPLRTGKTDGLHVAEPVVVESDCVQCSVTVNKGTLTPSMSATLIQSDINYETEIHPGDFVFVNMLQWETDARRVALKAKSAQPINGLEDGFKGMFKVQSVRKNLSVDPGTGIRTITFKIDGFGFTEFNNTIYFNPNLIAQKRLSNVNLYIGDIATAWSNYVSLTGSPALQDILAFLIQNLIGTGINPKARYAGSKVVSPNAHFLVPLQVGSFLGLTDDQDPKSKKYIAAKTAAQVYNYIFGIQSYDAGADQFADPGIGLNPKLKTVQEYPNFFYTPNPCSGNSILKPEYWNQVKVWSIMNQYTNAPLNELYTCFKVAPNGSVMPTVVFRQIPFTSEDFVKQKFGAADSVANSIFVTRFMTLPRWKITASEIFSMDIGRDEAARINFVQYYAKSNFTKQGVEIAGETAAGNYVYDTEDIKRSGLRPYVVQNQFDDLPNTLAKRAPQWARVLGDAVIGGHLKMNGTFSCIGIVEPIAVGDNLEFDDVVYHIEQITHSCAINPENGIKQFRTTISVSHGVSVLSSEKGTAYAEMSFANAYEARKNDYLTNGIMPGVSEAQDIVSRSPPKATDVELTKTPSINLSFPQPNPALKKGKK